MHPPPADTTDLDRTLDGIADAKARWLKVGTRQRIELLRRTFVNSGERITANLDFDQPATAAG